MGFKSVPYSTTVCGSNCEGCGAITLSAPNDATYSTTFTAVNFASYGTPNGSCGSYSFGGCHAGSSFGVVSNAFVGRTSGSVNPVNGTFGDPCVGTYKRLYIQLTASGTQQVFVPIPTINTFSASPNPQESISNGVPAYNTTLSWTTTNGSGGYATIVSSSGETYNVSSLGGNLNITNLPQSVVGTNSPATRSYTLTVYNELNEASTPSTITVSAYNDNSPTGLSIPSTTINNVSLNSLEPSTQYTIYLGAAGGIDMSTMVNCTTSGLEASSNQSNWSNIIYIVNTQGVYLRFTSQPFNTDPSGLTNSKSYSFSVGTYSNTFTARTRAPNVNELFDFGDNTTNYPNPDIDLLVNTTNPYIQSPTTITVDNVEVPVEIKVGEADAEIRIKTQGNSTFGSWQSVRQV